MKKEVDLTYIVSGLFFKFIPQSEAGEIAWRIMASKNNGNATFFTFQKNEILKQIRAAGYTVLKAREGSKKLTKADLYFLDQLQG